MGIFVKPMDRKSIEIRIDENGTIRDIKKRIQEKLRIDPVEQKLIFRGFILEDAKEAREYRICHKSEIYLVSRQR